MGGLRAAGALVAAAALIGACNSEPEAEPIPTTLPVLTTLRPQLTTTTLAAPPPQRRIYVVQPGDTLGKIAVGFGVTVEALMDENGKEDTLLRIGEQLVIPPTVVGGQGSP
ncbi:LysM peptidoglycan-binding domain-containing protein [Candidatus Poriferisodalis sp.]|uniref:LysM peptidoglycan-binding domain-containing protein n=1 Tax=Candidatus Poriferisodalis sp. TaxID=3101277 RepID=UPI003B024AC9